MSTEHHTSTLLGLLGTVAAFCLGVAMTAAVLFGQRSHSKTTAMQAWEEQSRCEASDRPEVCAAMRVYEEKLGRPFVPAK
jgi:hypothetical protein